MSISYGIIEIFTNEEAKVNGRPVWNEVVEHVAKSRVSARCIVYKGFAGCYEDGRVASEAIEVLSYNMPVKIEIVSPSAEIDALLSAIQDLVTEGVICVSERNRSIFRAKKHLIPAYMKVKDVMTASPVTVSEDTPATEVFRILKESSFNGVPVINLHNYPVGMITQSDFIRCAKMPLRLALVYDMEIEPTQDFFSAIRKMKASDLMTRPVIQIDQDSLLTDAVGVLLDNHLKRMPVVDAESRIVGMLARIDIFRIIADNSKKSEPEECKLSAVGDDATVASIMQKDVVTVGPDTKLTEMSKLFNGNTIQRLPVLDKQGKMLGIVFDADALASIENVRKIHFRLMEDFKNLRPIKAKEIPFFTDITAADIMKTDIISVSESTLVRDAIVLMTEKSIKKLPVTGNDGKFLGIVSRDALLRCIADH